MSSDMNNSNMNNMCKEGSDQTSMLLLHDFPPPIAGVPSPCRLRGIVHPSKPATFRIQCDRN